MSFIIRNISGVVVEIDDLGLYLDIGQEYDLSADSASDIAISEDLVAAVAPAGDIIVLDPLDGVTPLSVAQSVEAIKSANDTHFRIRGGELKQLDDVFSTMTPVDGQVLTFDTTNGWQSETPASGVTDHTLLTNIGTNTHAQIDTHITDGTIHFTEASIDHTAITNIGTNTHAQIDSHIALTNAHIDWTIDQGATNINVGNYIDTDTTDHTLLSNIGTNTHATIDSHISDATIHFTQAAISITESQISDLQSYLLDITGEPIGDLSDVDLTGLVNGQALQWNSTSGNWEVYTPTDNDTTDHTLLTNIGTNTHAQIDTHIGDATIHFTQASISITESQISDLQAYLLDITGESIKDLSDVFTTMTPVDGQVLTFDTTNGWQSETPTPGVTDHTLLTNIGTNTHAAIDSHIALTNAHIDWTIDQGATNIHVGNYTDTDTTDHTLLTNIGTNTHAAIDSHISDATIHFTQASISITESQISDLQAYLLNISGESITDLSDVLTSMTPVDGQVLTFDTTNGWQAETPTSGVTDHTLLTNIGTNTHAQIDTHIALTNEHIDWTVDQGATNIHSGNYTDTNTTDHTLLTNIGTNTHAAIDSHIADGTIHFADAPSDGTEYIRIDGTWANAASGPGTTAEIYDTIWAEENGTIANNNREWSFGNGSVGVTNVYAMYDCEITKMFVHAESPGTTTTMRVLVNDVIAGTGSFSANGVYTFPTAITVSEGDAIGFQTGTVVGTWTDVRVGVLLTSPIVGLVGATGADGLGVPAGGTAGQHLAKIDGTDNNTQWVDPPADQNLFLNVLSDAGTAVADNTTDTLSILGGTGISTSVTGDALTITNDSPNVDQNLWATITGDTGSATANTTTDSFDIGGTADQITTAITGDALIVALAANTIIPGNEAVGIPTGTTAERPTIPVTGDMRFNTTTGSYEAWDGSSWLVFGSAVGSGVKEILFGQLPHLSGTTQIPFDNSPPLITEGTAFFSQSVTTTTVTGRVVIWFSSIVSISNANRVATISLFRDGVLVGVTAIQSPRSNGPQTSTFIVVDAPGAAGTYTYSGRIGVSAGATWRIGGFTSNANYGGAANTNNQYVLMRIE